MALRPRTDCSHSDWYVMPAQAAADSRAPASSIAVNVAVPQQPQVQHRGRAAALDHDERHQAATVTAISAIVSVDPHAPLMSA